MSSIQRVKPKKGTNPKRSLIQIFMETVPDEFTTHETLASSTTSTSKETTSILTTFSSQLAQFPSGSTSIDADLHRASNTSSNKSLTNNSKRKLTKESKFKEITRLCLYQTQAGNNSAQRLPTLSSTSTTQAFSQTRCRQNLMQFIAKEFLTDSRQRLDFNTFKRLLELFSQRNLKDSNDETSFEENIKELNEIYQLIKSDFNLCNKFSAFLTSETALHFGIFTQYCQYEKCFEFLQKLEILIPNKCTFKKLVQSITAACNTSYESETVANKIEDIKSKIKTVTKNNALIDIELDYLFDQRWTNLKPVYEKINLADEPIEEIKMEYHVRDLAGEYIDLTGGVKQQLVAKANNNGKTKKKPIAKGKYESKKNKLIVTMKKLNE